jgi:hypothetical protein
MKKELNIEKRVNEALNSLDGVQRATSNPFLFTRIQQRLAAKNSPWEKAATFLARPVFAVAIIAVFLTVNIWAANKKSQVNLATKQQMAEQLFASEYSGVNYNLVPELNPDK